jgi:proline dehydrogenase
MDFTDFKTAFAYLSNFELMRSYILFRTINYPSLVDLGTRFVAFGLKIKAPVELILKPSIFNQFVGGESIEDCRPVVEKLRKFGVDSILDYSSEATQTEQERDDASREIEASIRTSLSSFGVFKPTAIIDPKVLQDSSLQIDTNPLWAAGKNRFMTLCKVAHECSMPVLIDQEESWYIDGIDRLYLEAAEKYNQSKPIVYNTYQLYLHRRLGELKLHLERAQSFQLGVKIVRGAYMEKEREHARKDGVESPVHANKEAVDKDYNEAIDLCVGQLSCLGFFCGTHNEKSSLILAQKIMPLSSDLRAKVCFSQLYGMGDHLSFNLAKAGFKVAKYLPYGPVRMVIPYLFRRAKENTSVQGQASRELQLRYKELKRRGLAL